MDKLISMVDYCQEVRKEFMMPKKPFNKNEWFGKILNYSDFLKQPLTLGMFVPCDLENDPLLPPGSAPIYTHSNKYMREYQEAKERVLFEGFKQKIYNNTGSFEIINDSEFQICAYKALPDYYLWFGCPEEKTVEWSLNFIQFTLTDSAKKQIGI